MRRTFLIALLASCMPTLVAGIQDDIPYASFTDKDRAIFQKALDGALDKDADGKASAWSNPDTKARGEIKPVKSFQRAGSPCRTATITNHAKGRSATGPFTFCKEASGRWKVVPADPAPAKPPA
jgi:surface antigen